MANETKPAILSEAEIKTKLEALKADVQKLAGMKGFNPFLWFAKNVAPHADKFATGDRSPATMEALSKLPSNVPAPKPAEEVAKK